MQFLALKSEDKQKTAKQIDVTAKTIEAIFTLTFLAVALVCLAGLEIWVDCIQFSIVFSEREMIKNKKVNTLISLKVIRQPRKM